MIYELCDVTIDEDLMILKQETFQDIMDECYASTFERIPKQCITITASDSSGIEFPDYFYHNYVPLFSQRVYERIDGLLQPEIFVRDVNVCSPVGKETRAYKMVLPKRIDCVDTQKSILRPLVPGVPNSPIRVEKLVVDENLLGNATIFKLAGVKDSGIYIRSELYKILYANDWCGMEFCNTGG